MATTTRQRLVSLLAKQRGSSRLRRWWKIHSTLISKVWWDTDHIKPGPLTLFDFSSIPNDAHDVKHASSDGRDSSVWRLSDDQVIGGYSNAQVKLIQQQQENDNNNEQISSYLSWSGHTDTRIGKTHRKVRRSGYCAIQSPILASFPMGHGLNLGDKFNALELTCRQSPTDKNNNMPPRTYTVNLSLTTFFPDDLYQHQIQLPPPSSSPNNINNNNKDNNHTDNQEDKHRFHTVILPFRDFLHTSFGREREVQRILDGSILLESIGFTLMDGKDGPFSLDLARIRVVNYFDGIIFGQNDEDAPY